MAVNRKSEWKYHVFLSFRGVDTRLSFTDHLYAKLDGVGIKTFKDDEELPRGEVISKKLLQAIEESLSAIVIISQNYASSTWCLDELQKILEAQKQGLQVFPVFYRVDPSDVRHRRGDFAKAFKKHEIKFVGDEGKLQKWRDALEDVANLSGWDSRDMREVKLVEEITATVWTKVVQPNQKSSTKGLVGMDAKVDELIHSYLELESKDVRFIGIWGMGGIGKTTLANNIYNKIEGQFEVSCILEVGGKASKEGDHGLVQLQNDLLSRLKLSSMIINDNSYQGKDRIRNLLWNRKVLLVLDDVSANNQLEKLAGEKEWFGPGSRIIVTTRDKQLLTSHGILIEDWYCSDVSVARTWASEVHVV